MIIIVLHFTLWLILKSFLSDNGLKFANWAPGEPASQGGCVWMCVGVDCDDYYWRVTDCAKTGIYLCQVECESKSSFNFIQVTIQTYVPNLMSCGHGFESLYRYIVARFSVSQILLLKTFHVKSITIFKSLQRIFYP